MEGKVAVVSGRTAIKRMKAREILVYTYKIKYIHIYIYYKDKILKHKRAKIEDRRSLKAFDGLRGCLCVIRDGIISGVGQ